MEMYENMERCEEAPQTETGMPVQDKAAEDFSYNGYEVVRGAFFAHLFEPSVKIVKETVSVNSACIRRLPDTEYVQFLVNRDEKKLAVKPSAEDVKDSFRWASVGKDGKIRPKTISCKPFFDKIMKLMEWDPDTRYRIMGKFIRTKQEMLFVFDLKEPECFKRKGKVSYPQAWDDSFGVSAEEHQSDGLVSFCENSSVFYLERDDVESKTQEPSAVPQEQYDGEETDE